MAVSIYLQVPDIVGSVTATGFQEHMELSAVSFSAKNTDHHPSDGGRGSVQMGDFIISKELDASAVSILQSLTSRIVYPEIKIKFARLGGGSSPTIPFLVYTLTKAFIRDYSMVAGAGELNPAESLTFSYTKLEQKYTELDQAGRPRGQEVMSYDLRSGTGR